jgi:hypothetical protein
MNEVKASEEGADGTCFQMRTKGVRTDPLVTPFHAVPRHQSLYAQFRKTERCGLTA